MLFVKHKLTILIHISILFISSTTSKKDDNTDFKCYECSSIAHEGGTDACRNPKELQRFQPLRKCNNWKDAHNADLVEKMLEKYPDKKFISACHRAFYKSGNYIKVTRNCKALPDINEKRNRCTKPSKDELELAKSDQMLDGYGWSGGVESMMEVCYCDGFNGCNYDDKYPPENITLPVVDTASSKSGCGSIVGLSLIVTLRIFA